MIPGLFRCLLIVHRFSPFFQLVSFLHDIFTHCWQVRSQYIGCLASVLSGLSIFHKEFAVRVVDDIINDIQVGMQVGVG